MRVIKFRFWNGKNFEYWDHAKYWESLGLYLNGMDDYISEQFTGLKDKNGVEIYEGDILGNGQFTHEVVFKEMKFSTPNHGGSDTYICVGFERKIYFGDICDWVVIGNIHQNKDLL